MYRILEEAGEVRERRDPLRHPNYSKPELLATGPNEVWSWDITKLLRHKAARGELRRGLPIGFVWGDENGEVRFHPDAAVVAAIRTVFERFAQLGSARRVWLWFHAESLNFPLRFNQTDDIRWTPPTYTAIHHILTNPVYAGRGVYCLNVGGVQIDEAVTQTFLEALEPAGIQAALCSAQQLEADHDTALAQWQLALERARYKAERAERRYRAVEPENRLVARGLEAEWEERLQELDQAQAELTRRKQQRPTAPDTRGAQRPAGTRAKISNASGSPLERRLVDCGLELHPQKTKIVYCKDDDRRGNYPEEKFDFLGYTFRPRRSKNRWGKYFVNFSPGVSNAATKAIRRAVRRWRLGCRVDKRIDDLARMFNPIIRGWLNYYTRYYKSALYPTLQRTQAPDKATRERTEPRARIHVHTLKYRLLSRLYILEVGSLLVP